jgi:hypothetical protein
LHAGQLTWYLTACHVEIRWLGNELEQAFDISAVANGGPWRYQHRGPGGNPEADRFGEWPSAAQTDGNRGDHRVSRAHAAAGPHPDRREVLTRMGCDQQRALAAE